MHIQHRQRIPAAICQQILSVMEFVFPHERSI